MTVMLVNNVSLVHGMSSFLFGPLKVSNYKDLSQVKINLGLFSTRYKFKQFVYISSCISNHVLFNIVISSRSMDKALGKPHMMRL